MRGPWKNELSAMSAALSSTGRDKACPGKTLMDYDLWKLTYWRRTTRIRRSRDERTKNYASTVGSQGTSYEIVNRGRSMVKGKRTSIRKGSDLSPTPKRSAFLKEKTNGNTTQNNGTMTISFQGTTTQTERKNKWNWNRNLRSHNRTPYVTTCLRAKK